jgi:hypothetical protein
MALNDQTVGTVDGSGKKVDVTEITVNSVVAERQRVNLSDAINAGALQVVDMEGKAYGRDLDVATLLTLILAEQRVTNLYLAAMSSQHFDANSLT